MCGFSLVAVSQGYSLVVVHRLLIVVASLAQSMGSRAHRLGSCGLFTPRVWAQ